ncbi:hypothetical protein GCM10027425_28800 [Alteromonas gracilis]
MDTPERDPREIELLGAALADELTAEESAELAERCAADPTLAAELEALGGTAAQVRDSGLTRWRTAGRPAPWAPPAQRRRWPQLAAAAVAAFVLGVVGTLAVTGGEERDAVAGPPGTLGAVEPIDFTGLPEGGSVQASLIAHTWGTETVLEVDGFPVGESVEVVLVTEGRAEPVVGVVPDDRRHAGLRDERRGPARGRRRRTPGQRRRRDQRRGDAAPGVSPEGLSGRRPR